MSCIIGRHEPLLRSSLCVDDLCSISSPRSRHSFEFERLASLCVPNFSQVVDLHKISCDKKAMRVCARKEFLSRSCATRRYFRFRNSLPIPQRSCGNQIFDEGRKLVPAKRIHYRFLADLRFRSSLVHSTLRFQSGNIVSCEKKLKAV